MRFIYQIYNEVSIRDENKKQTELGQVFHLKYNKNCYNQNI